RMVNDQHIEEKISWSENGESFIVFDIYEFSEAILPQYFKHNKWSSFVRQLNTYGFCKVTDYKNDNDKQTSEFRHPLFYRNGQHVLHKIRR
ncbi:HSF-type DNA-binding-domain-containing protein, partial [Cunninghamella echinulata]